MSGGPKETRGRQARSISLFFVVLIAVLSFTLGTKYTELTGDDSPALLFASPQSSTLPSGVDFSPVWRVWHMLDEKYVSTGSSTPVTDEDRVWGMAEGLARSLDDPYTVFLPPSDNAIFADDISGNFEGVGMEIGIRSGLVTVIAPLKGTPAERAGVLAGDHIFEIDGESTDDMPIDGAVKRIRGERGTEVVLTVAREGENELIEIPIIRDVIEIPTIETILREDDIFIIELYNFSAVSTNLFREALRDFVESGSNKLILDLRGNPGGFLEAAVDMASWFLPAGEVVVREDFGDRLEPVIHRSKGYDIFEEELEMVVLIDQGSASASEILAGALSEHGIATLLGETSFGKGSVQELLDVTDDTSLKVTIARWMTPNNVSISLGGLEPDVVVEMTIEDIEAERDPQLEKAIEILNDDS